MKCEDNNNPCWIINCLFVMTIVVISVYCVVLYLKDFSFNQKTAINNTNMTDTLILIQNVLGTKIIPLIIGIFLNVITENKIQETCDRRD